MEVGLSWIGLNKEMGEKCRNIHVVPLGINSYKTAC